MIKIGFSSPDEGEEDTCNHDAQYGELDIIEDASPALASWWLSSYAVQLPALLWALILTLTVGFASGILRVEFGRA